VAVLHVALGVVTGGARLRALAARGWSALSGAAAEERLAFWFVAAGLLLAVVGTLADGLAARGARLPTLGGVLLLGVAVGGVVLDPASGFWLLVPPALGWVRQSRARPAASAPAS
jgi:hypothetical protein